jgi:hypothetical protein
VAEDARQRETTKRMELKYGEEERRRLAASATSMARAEFSGRA